jgi:SAM-dependent methyltransferase
VNDYSEFLTPEKLEIEEEGWAEGFHNKKMADLVTSVCDDHDLITVIEMGCGTGWVPFYLPQNLLYLGVDKNSLCIQKAWAKNFKIAARRHISFVCDDIRDFILPDAPFDMVVSLSVLKHFRPEEWQYVFIKIMEKGDYACFTMSIGPNIVNDGVEFPHTYITKELLLESLELAGKKILTEEALTPDVHGMEYMFSVAPKK